MELRHLRYFIAVAEEQNVTRAAARLHVSQPALSRQIRDLEDELGVAFFEHGAKALRLTDAGRLFLTEARSVVQRAEEAVTTIKAVSGQRQREIRLGYAPSLTVQILPQALRSFQTNSPHARVVLHDLSTEEMLVGLRESRLDVALMIRPQAKALAGLIFEEVARYAVCVAMHPSHHLARLRKISLRELAGERIIGYTRKDYPEYHEWLADLFGSQAFRLASVEEHDSATSLIAAVEAGRGVAVVQQGFECMAGPRLKVSPLLPPPEPFVVGLARRKGKAPPHVEKFVEVVLAMKIPPSPR